MDGTHRAAVAGDTVVGALRLLLPVLDNTTVAYVDLAVHPEYRRRGIGSALLQQAEELAGSAGRSARRCRRCGGSARTPATLTGRCWRSTRLWVSAERVV